MRFVLLYILSSHPTLMGPSLPNSTSWGLFLLPMIINPRRACAGGLVGSVCVCLSVKSLERLFVLKILSRTLPYGR